MATIKSPSRRPRDALRHQAWRNEQRTPETAPRNREGNNKGPNKPVQHPQQGLLFSFRVRVACSSRPPCSIVAGYACSHPCMVFIRVVSLLDVGLVFVGSLENSWLVVVIRLSCVWIEVHSSSTCCWVSSFRPHPLHIVFVYGVEINARPLALGELSLC